MANYNEEGVLTTGFEWGTAMTVVQIGLSAVFSVIVIGLFGSLGWVIYGRKPWYADNNIPSVLGGAVGAVLVAAVWAGFSGLLP